VEEISRRFLQLRYQLLPYLYGRFAEARATGAPIMRPLFWHYQNDPVAAACGDQFLLGRDLLVAPVLRQGAQARVVYLPNDVWYNYWTGERISGGQHIAADAPLDILPLYVRAGGILPMAESQPFVGSQPQDVLLLQCWPGAAGGMVTAAIEDAARLRDALGVVLPPGVPIEFCEPVADPVGDLVHRFARTHGPFDTAALAHAIGLAPAVAELAMQRLAASGRVISGQFRPGGKGLEWCEPEVLRRIRRRSVARLRHEAEPVAGVAFAEFLLGWQQVAEAGQSPNRGGADAVLAASIFHYGEYTVRQAKEYMREHGIEVRL
jgi:hypothetical protein